MVSWCSKLTAGLVIHLALALLLTALASSATAQSISPVRVDSITAIDPTLKQGIFEAITAEPNAEQFFGDWLEELTTLSEIPLALPFATPEMLRKIPGLDAFDRKKLSDSTTNSALIAQSPYITSHQTHQTFLAIRSRLQVDPNASDQAGFQSGAFVGSVQKYYDVVRAAAGILSGEFVQAKDPGEARFDDRLNGFLNLRTPIGDGGITLSQAVLGNYRLAFGNGLLFGDPLSSIKTREAVHSTDPHTGGVMAATRSTSPLGVAATVHLDSLLLGLGNDVAVSVFAAKTPIDAVLDSTGITTIYTDGYHRTLSELAHRETANLSLVGGHVGFSHDFRKALALSIGATASYAKLDHPISINSGSSSIGEQIEKNVSLDVEATTEHVALAGEIASSMSFRGNTIAESVNLQLEPNSEFSLALDYRSVPAGFLTRYGAVFGERTSSGGSESGLYAGIDWKIFPETLTLSAYTDLSTTAVATASQSNAPITPDYFAGVTCFAFDKSLELHGQFHTKSKEESATQPDTNGTPIPLTGERKQSSLLFEGKAHVFTWLKLLFGAQSVAVRHSASAAASADGAMGYLGVRVRIFTQLTLESRYVLFHATSYDARMYEYEPGVPGTSDLSALYADGHRAFLQAEFEPSKEIKISSKFSVTTFNTPRTFGSGVTARTGSVESRFSLQADLRF